MTTSLKRRLNKLEEASDTVEDKLHSVRFVLTPDEARPPQAPDGKVHMWGTGPTSWQIYVAPNHNREKSLRAVGLDPEKDRILCWG